MEGFFTLKTFLRLLAAAVVLAAGIVLVDERLDNLQPARQAEIREVTRVVQQTVLVTTVVERLITPVAEDLPASNPAPLFPEEPTATSTPVSLAVLPGGVAVWCLPRDSVETGVIPVTGQPPQDAVLSESLNGSLTVFTQVKSCTFLVAFNQAVPAGVRFKVQDLNPQPFIDEELQPVEGDANTAFVNLDHIFIVDPPYWEVSYRVAVVAADGSSLWENPVLFKRSWFPQPCADGSNPDPVSMECPVLPQ